MITVNRPWTAVAVALPGVLLAVLGLMHPDALAPSTAARWVQVHLLLLPVFPLLAVALGVLLRGESGVVAALARVAAYGYAVLYTALDVLAGIAAGVVTDRLRSGSQVALDLRALGTTLGTAGSAALLVAAVLTGAVLLRQHGPRTLPGTAALCAGAVAFGYGHVYWPVGGLGALGVAAGCALLALASVHTGSSAPR